jgi:3-oxoacyl-[acyl-carrier-protein] synthase III
VSRGSDPSRFALVDSETITESALYGSMYLAGDEFVSPRGSSGPFIPGWDDHQFTWPYFHITDQGHSAFLAFGQRKPVEAVTTLLARNGVNASEVTLIAHQASSVLLDYWQTNIVPGSLLDTMASYGDAPQSNLPITLAARYSEIETQYLVLLALGVEFSTTAILFARGA